MDYTRELTFAKDLAFKAGEVMLSYFSRSTITVKRDLTPVTEADIAISRMVINEVRESFPTHSVMDEETQNGANQSEYLWVCDPIDGTIPFSHHIPAAAFSIALCKNGDPVVAVTYDPFMKRMLYTKSGDKSYMNGKVIKINKDKLKPGDFIFGKPYWKPGMDVNKFIKLLRAKGHHDFIVGSIVYEGMMVALGIVKAMVTIAANPWDRAAIMMIIENAGGKCTSETGKRLTVFGNPKYFIATNGTVHAEMLKLLKDSMA